MDILIGYDSLVINEFFQGNRTSYSDSKVCGVFTGLSLAYSHEYIYRAIQEAVCYSVEADLCKLHETGSGIQEFVVCDGAARSRMQTQIHSNVTGVLITLTKMGDAVTPGLCILAAASAGLYGSIQEAADAMVHERERIEPDTERHGQYKFYADQYYKQFPLVQGLIHETVDHVAAEHTAAE